MSASHGRGHRLELDDLASRWQRALDAADRALAAAHGSMPDAELTERARALTAERGATAQALGRLAHVAAVRPAPWLAPVPLRPELLGLDRSVGACLFDLEGVLTDSASLHAWAWGEAFDELVRHFGERTGRVVMPFDRRADYRDYVEGRSRLEGVQTFLRARGIGLPMGEPDDPAGIDTVHGVARRKSEALTRRLDQQGVTALPGARRYLDAVGRLELARAVLSASVRTASMLELAGLAAMVDERVDADRIRAEGLRSRPAPDAVLAVCRHLGVEPGEAVAFTSSPLGVTAYRTAGAAVVGVGDASLAAVLEEAGAERVVGSLAALLDPRLAQGL
jgi:beta-phosphoglucomutase-like phosphatase (HAD superfamily)